MFTTSWLALGLALLTSVPGSTSIVLGFFLLGFAGAVLSMAFAAGAGKPLIALILTLSATRAILAGLFETSSTIGFEHAAAYVAATLTAFAWYAGTAFLLEDLRQQPLLPVFRRGAATTAMQGTLREQLERASSEAGVRQQL